MTHLEIDIPDDIVASLKELAAKQAKTVEEVAVEQLVHVLGLRRGSPSAVLQALREVPYLSKEDTDELMAAINAPKTPQQFDRLSKPSDPPPGSLEALRKFLRDVPPISKETADELLAHINAPRPLSEPVSFDEL